jgi:hypothetical protein
MDYVFSVMRCPLKLLSRKEQLLARLEADPGSNERAEIQTLLAKIETALKLLVAWYPGFRRYGRRSIVLGEHRIEKAKASPEAFASRRFPGLADEGPSSGAGGYELGPVRGSPLGAGASGKLGTRAIVPLLRAAKFRIESPGKTRRSRPRLRRFRRRPPPARSQDPSGEQSAKVKIGR